MVNDHCSEFEELLVDLADGELSDTEQQRVCDHVEGCSECRDLLDRLNASLAYAKCIWNDAQQDHISGPEPLSTVADSIDSQRRSDRVTPSVTALIVAAALLLIALPRFSQRDVESTDIGSKKVATADNRVFELGPKIEEDMDIEQLLYQREQAARLFAVVEILDENPELDDVCAQTRKYLQTHYGDP